MSVRPPPSTVSALGALIGALLDACDAPVSHQNLIAGLEVVVARIQEREVLEKDLAHDLLPNFVVVLGGSARAVRAALLKG